MKAMKSGMFAFPPLIDVKIDQPEARFTIDRDKVASLGLNLGQIGGDMGGMVGGNYVNRFDISGRSYKVIPQIQRIDRLNPGQLETIYVTGPGGKLIQLNTVASVSDAVGAPLPEPLPAVERGQDQRRADAAAGRGARAFWRERRARSSPKGTSWTTPASRASSAPKGTNSSPPSPWPSS